MSAVESKCINCGHPFLVNFPDAAQAAEKALAERADEVRALTRWAEVPYEGTMESPDGDLIDRDDVLAILEPIR